MRALTCCLPSGKPKQLLLLLYVTFCVICQPSRFDLCAVSAFAPATSIPQEKYSRALLGYDRSSLLAFRLRSSSSLAALAATLTRHDENVVVDVETKTTEIGNNLKTVKLLTTSAIFHCGTEEGFTALSVLNELCERRLPFDFDDSFFHQQEKDPAVSASITNIDHTDKGERVISRLPKFLPDTTTNEFLESVRFMEEQGWMSTNPDSVDGLPSLHLNLVSNGQPIYTDEDEDDIGDEISFRSLTHKLYDLVKPFVYDTLLPEADRLLRTNGQGNNSTRQLRVSDIFLRRYGQDICGSVTRNGISIHYDVYSRITAVVALDEVASRGNNGLFTLDVDEQTGETSNHKALRRFFPLTTGDCVLHTWDVLHGVDVEAGLDRTSLIVWFDEDDENTGVDDEDKAKSLPSTTNNDDDESASVSPWLSLERQGSTLLGDTTTLRDGNDVRQFVLASALASASSPEIETEETATNSLYLTSASKGNSFALTRMGSICEEGDIGELKKEAFRVLDELRPFEELPEILKDMLTSLYDNRDGAMDDNFAERTELACRFWLEGSLTGNPLAQKSLADEVMVEASRSGNPHQRLLAATLFALASQQETNDGDGPSDSLARVIEYDVASRGVESREEFLASPVVQTASAALGGL